MKGYIPYSTSTRDQLRPRLLNLLGTPSTSHTATHCTAQTASGAAGFTASTNDGVLQAGRTASPLVEIHGNAEPAPTPRTPSTPSSEGSNQGEQHRAANEGIQQENDVPEYAGQPSASDTTAPTAPASGSSTNQVAKSTPQLDWKKMQLEREKRQREERERIKAQIKHDHAERRRLDEIRRQPAVDLSKDSIPSSSKRTTSSDIRIQIRTFDGSTLRSTFPRNSSIAGHVRPWIDSTAQKAFPYNLKIILTPRPNRTIEATEEERSLEDLDMVGSCTMVMVPVKGYVESYAPSGSGLIGSAVSGGYNLVTGTVGAVFGGVQSWLGFGQATHENQARSASEATSPPPAGQVRVRTLADQRMEAKRNDQQFYNGNQLNFEPRKDDDDGKQD
jgi:UBX domain